MADDGSQSPSKRKVPALDTTVIEEVTAPSVQKISPQSPAKRKVHASDKVPAPPAPAPTDGGPKSPTKRNMPALDTSTTTSATAPPAAETGPQSTTKRERPAVDAPAAKINAGSPTEHSGPRNPSKRKRSANDTTAAVEANVTGAVTDGEPEAKIQRTSSKDDQPAARVQRASRSRNQAAQPAVSDQATASEKIGERKPASKKSMEKKADADPKPTKSKVPQAPSAKGAAAKGAKIVNAVKPRSKMLKAELMQELERRDTEVEGLKEHVRDLLEERTASKTTFKYRDATLSKHDPEHSRLSAIDDELARKIQTLWDSVTFWTLGNFADAKLGERRFRCHGKRG